MRQWQGVMLFTYRRAKGILYPISFFFVSFSGPSLAGTCPELRSAQDVLDCALKNHPDIHLSAAEVEAARKLRPVAELKPNPELNNKTLSSFSAANQVYAEFNLMQTIERGGKREARVSKADAVLEVQLTSAQVSKQSVYREAAMGLYRLRQIMEELKVLDDVIGTYRKIRKALQRRPVLTPDQKASVHLFEIAESNYQFRKLPLQSEWDQVARDISYALQQDFQPAESLLPPRITAWPTLPKHHSKQEVASAEVLQKKAEIESSKADIWISRAEQSFDYRVGPSLEFIRQYDQNVPSLGFSFAMDLPFYHRNEAQTALAAEALKVSEQKYSLALAESQKQRQYYAEKYARHLEATKTMPSYSSLNTKHDEIEKLFLDGFIGSGPVLDVHQQLYDFVKSQNDTELAMVDALLRLYAYAGKRFEVMP